MIMIFIATFFFNHSAIITRRNINLSLEVQYEVFIYSNWCIAMVHFLPLLLIDLLSLYKAFSRDFNRSGKLTIAHVACRNL